MRRRFVIFAAAALVATALPIASAGAHEGPDLTPAEVTTDNLAVGFEAEFDVDKTVHTPELPPVLDVCLIVDNSGSYNNDLPNIKTLAPGIWDSILAGGVSDLQMGLATFVDFPFEVWGFAASFDYAYQLDQQLTPTKATWVAAVTAMSARSGFDDSESQYEALYQVATGAGNDVPPAGASLGDIAPGQQCNFRANATKVAILTTDASFHNAGDGGGPFPYPGHSAAATTTALQAAGIVVIGLKAPGAGGELDALAAATGGTTVPTSSTSDDIADAILDALTEIDVEVSMASNCSDPITTTFAPASVTVESGEHAVFTETIAVADAAAPGVYECEDWALIDRQPMVDEAGDIIVETKTITVVAPSCEPTENPHGNKKPTAPGNGGQGQNQDGFYEIGSSSGEAVFVLDDGSGSVFGPLSSGDEIKYVEDDTAIPNISPMGANNSGGNNGPNQGNDTDWEIIGNGDALVVYVDGFGNVTVTACLVPSPPK